jgi:hypothetical protein
MPRIHWKPLLIVLVLAILFRLVLERQSAVTLVDTPPQEEVLVDEEIESSSDEDLPDEHGALTFDTNPIDLKPKPEEDEISTTFSFTNTSSRTVTVTHLESTCSCLEAELDKRNYAPGEKGIGKALFKVSSFVGQHEKTVHLFTDDPESPEQVLTFLLDVPVVVSIEPNLLEWTQHEQPSTKQITIKMVGADPMRITKIEPTQENVRFELKEVSPGREFHLLVTPHNTENITYGGFKLETDSKIPKYARQMAFFSIVRPELAEKKEAAKAAKK